MPDDLGRAIDLIVDQVSQRLTTRPPTTGLAHVWRAGLSYAEGQTVRYMGGMWQAQCETRAPPGTPGEWLLLCDGIRRMIAATPGPDEDPRHYAIIAMLSSGIDIELPFLLPLPVNRGAFQHGVDYRLGDEVEHGGSTFRATRDDPGVPPNERWQLIAARGHTGEQGPCGIQGERGDIGPRGLQGERGDKGERGGVGERGERGQTGETGPRGADLRDWELVRIGPRMMLRMEMSDGALSDPVPWPSMQFVGVYQPGERYQRGDVVRFGFVLWIATVDTEAVPTINTDDWEVLLPGVDPSGTGGGGGGGSNLPTLDARYLQLIGGQMTGTIAFDRDQLGLLWIGANAAVYNDAQGLILRRGLFDPPVWVENNDGLPASRRRILTEDDLPGLGGFLPLSGGLMTGTIGFDGSNLGLHWNNEAAMYLSSDGLILRRDAADNPVQIEAGAGTITSRRPILTTDTGVLKAGDTMSGDLTLAGDPTADLHAVPRRYLHGNFLPLDGGQMRGQVIATQGGLGAPGLAIGSGDTGFYRLATSIVIGNGPTIVATFSPAIIGFASPLAMSGRKIENLGTPTVATDAVTKQYVDTLAASIAPARRKVSSALNHMTIPPTPGETPIFDGDFDLGVPVNGPRSIRVIIDPIFALADQVQDIRATIIYRSNLNAFDVPLDIYKFTVAQTGFSRAPVSFAGPLAANAGIVRVTITAQLAASTPIPLSNALLHVGAGGPYGNLRSFITLEDWGRKMDEASLAEQLASALVERLGSQQAGRLIGVADLAPTASVDLSTQARQWREGDIYETGAVATYSGGLWQARNKTASRPPGRIGEWLLLCDGVKTVQGYRRGGDARAFGLIVLMASGETIDLPFDLPIPNHRGHWREHDLYTQGDEVEWNGATYRALHNAPGAPNTDDWRLVSGRGLTGDRGERGERGDTGERGETGDRGLTGPAGERGERGFPGQMGPGIRAIEQVPGYPGIVRAVLDDGTITNPVRVSGMQFVGVYQPGASYQRGDIVRLGFHLFIAVEPTETVPSTNSSDWALFLTGQEPGGAAGGGGGGGGLDIPTADARYLQLIGGSLTGKLATPGTVISDPTGTVATKGYVDGLNLIMDGRVAALDARVAALDARVAALDARVTALENAP